MQLPTASPSESWRNRLPFYYGWVIVGSWFVNLFVIYGVYYSFSVFYVALLEEYGWTRAAAAGVFSIFVLVTAVAGPLGGGVIDKFGPCRVVPAGGVLLALGLYATSRLTQLWEFYLYFGVVCGLALAVAGWVPAVAVLSRWFSAKRGTAIGIASAGIGLGTVVMVPFNQYLMSTVGWRTGYLVLAAMSLLLIAPQTALFQLGRPEEMGMKSDGLKAGETGKPVERRRTREIKIVDPKWASQPWTLATAVRTSRFWLVTAAFFLNVLTNQMLWVHQAAYLVDGGFEKMLAASVVGLAGFVSMPMKILMGWLSDRIGREYTFTLGVGAVLLSILTLVVLKFLPFPWIAFVFALLFGTGYAVMAPVGPTTVADIFMSRNYGAIYGLICVGQGIGTALGAWGAGYIFDATGSYMAAFAIGAGCATVSISCMWLASPRLVRRVVSRAESSPIAQEG